MKTRSWWLWWVVALVLSGAAPSAQIDEGIGGAEWVNLIGEEPTLENLEGRAVILHFFDPPQNQRGGGRDDGGGLAAAYFSFIRKFHHDYASKGVVILGFSSESRSKVEGYIAKYNIPYPIAIKGNARRRFNVSDACHLILLDRNGEVYWEGPTTGLWNGKLNKGAKGSKRLGDRGLLALHVNRALGKRAQKAADQCAQGDLAKALKTIDGLLASDLATPGDKGEAEALQKDVVDHIARLMEQIDACLEMGEVLLAVDALELLAKELKKHDLGATAKERLEEVLASEEMQQEIKAAKDYKSVEGSFYKRGLRANLPRLERIVEAYPDTMGAQKARNLIQGR